MILNISKLARREDPDLVTCTREVWSDFIVNFVNMLIFIFLWLRIRHRNGLYSSGTGHFEVLELCL